ncbi:hypothetical protein ILUMI_22513 [Ignelater luminosus]|uniref:Uncharacterized protein n=1 Tax=Ignelater luminosus TaxID=2038154 RepID=A0A8K0CDN9_IGNLU|nr:hypothetical protein ILUMI_22513 [Ignelater luminosus]
MDRAECSWFNRSSIKYLNLSFIPYNRTQRVLNADFELLINMGRDLMTDVQLYKMMSNEYRFFPLTFKANACVEYRKNSFSLKDMLTGTSNLTPCNMKKVLFMFSS